MSIIRSTCPKKTPAKPNAKVEILNTYSENTRDQQKLMTQSNCNLTVLGNERKSFRVSSNMIEAASEHQSFNFSNIYKLYTF